MKENKFDRIFKQGNCLPEELLVKYANKQASAEEEHEVERHSMNCDMCADIIEGLLLQQEQDINRNVKELEARIDDRVILQKQPQKQWQWLAAAASIALLVGIGFYFYSFEPEKQLAENLSKKEILAKPVIDSLKEGEANTIKISEPLEERKLEEKPEAFGKPELEQNKKVDSSKSIVADKMLLSSGEEGTYGDYTSLADSNLIAGYRASTKTESVLSFSTVNDELKQGAFYNTDMDRLDNASSSDSIRVADQYNSTLYKSDKSINYNGLSKDLKNESYSNEMTKKEQLQMESNMSYHETTTKPALEKSSGKTVKSKSVTDTKSLSSASTYYDSSPRQPDAFESDENKELENAKTKNNLIVWPYASIPLAKAFVLTQNMSTINLGTIDQEVKEKTVNLHSNSANELINTINATSFTKNYSRLQLHWRYVILFYNSASKPIAYIAVSDDKKTVMRFPDEGFSSSQELIDLLKTLLP